MFESFKRSWELTKVTLSVIRQDKELIAFPILAGLFSTLFFIAMIFPMVLSPLLFNGNITWNLINWFIIILIYFGLAFISTFFSVCVVYTAKKRFEGENATFMESVNFAFSKIHLIFAWSVVSAIVGLILRIIYRMAEKIGGVGEIIIRIITSLLGGAWAMITIFVIPGMVYNGYGPIEAIKNSAKAFKKTWGENLIRAFGFGLIELLFFGLGFAIAIALIMIGMFINSLIIYLLIAIFVVIYFVSVFTFFALANTIYSTALYVYAEKGKIPGGFTKETVAHAFTKKEKR